jgi:hypothetical protein
MRLIKSTRYKLGSYAPQGAFFGPAAGIRPAGVGDEPSPSGLLAQSSPAVGRGFGGAGGGSPRWETRSGNLVGWVGFRPLWRALGDAALGGELVIFRPKGVSVGWVGFGERSERFVFG